MNKTDGQFNHTYSQLAQRLNTDSSASWCVHEQALQMKRRGEDVVLLSIGDPDFRTPEPIIDNAVSHLRVGRTHYSPALGEMNLRRAVADYETRTSPHPCDAKEVSIYPGVTSAIYTVLSCLLNAGDEILIVDPWYVGYEPIIHALNVELRTIKALPENNFKPQLSDFQNAIGDQTRLVLINTPANPSGAIMEHDTLADLARICYDKGIWLVCDEVYSMFTYEKPHISLRKAADRLDNIVVIDGLSKSHAMSGWRMGWVVAPLELTAYLGRFSAMSLFGCPQFIQDAAAFALSNDEDYVRQMCGRYQKRRDLVCARLDKMACLTYQRPESGMFIMVDVSQIDQDDKVFAQKLLDAQKVSVLPGSAFGDSARGYVRFSLAQAQNILTQGCDRLEKFLQCAV